MENSWKSSGLAGEEADKGEAEERLGQGTEEMSDTLPLNLNGDTLAEPPRESEEQDSDRDISADVESKISLKEKRIGFLKNLQGPPMTFKLLLDCTRKKTTEEKVLTVNGDILAVSVYELKLCIEHHHSIPACMQTLVFDGVTLEDHKTLSDYYIRDGDFLKVSFERTGNLSEIMAVIDSMKVTYVHLKALKEGLREGTLTQMALLEIRNKVCSQEVESLPEMYLATVADQAEVNRVFFVDCGGVRMCHKLHEELLKYPWSHLPLKLQALELAILRCYWNLTADFSVRSSVLHKSEALQNIIMSFLRIKIDDKARRLQPPVSVYREQDANLYNYDVHLPFKSLGALANLAEVPECHLKIASNEAVLKQLVGMMECVHYRPIAGMMAVGGMLCLAHSSSTHKYLLAWSVVNGVAGYCTWEAYVSPERAQLSKLTRYFAVLLFTIILTSSPHLVDIDTRMITFQLCKIFYKDADYTEMRRDEVKMGVKWSTLLPYMKLAYHPYSHPDKDLSRNEFEFANEMRLLNRYCIKSGIFSLSNMLQCPDTRDIFIREGLLDYLVCMPWLYPRDWPEREMAEELVSFMSQHVRLDPPSLLNMAKAKLAGMCFGLEKVLKTNTVHDLLT